IYFYEFKLGCGAAATARNTKETFSQEYVNKCTLKHWFEKSLHGKLDVECERGRGRPSAVGDDKLKGLEKK
ncbi:hypothetical protein Angca_002579, partial [Angiostrongylus cantonensis]